MTMNSLNDGQLLLRRKAYISVLLAHVVYTRVLNTYG